MDRVDYQSMIIQDLVNDHKDKKLNLNPWYQRRSVWSKAQKAYLINTLFERKPIPALYIRHAIDLDKQRSIKELVDGQQRTRSVLEYCDNQFSARIEQGGTRKLFQQLTPSERERFLLTPLPIGFLLGASDEDVIDIFGRMNSISKSLNTQEKRNAKFSGEFKQFCLGFASSNLSFWRATNIFSSNDIARMNEVQFISDIVVNLIDGLADFRPADLDRAYKEFDDDFPRAQEILARLDNIFNLFFQMDPRVFKDTIFRRTPLFFSLIVCLDSHGGLTSEHLEEVMFQIDAEFHDQDNANKEISDFRDAMSASTQRLTSRAIRHEIIRSRL